MRIKGLVLIICLILSIFSSLSFSNDLSELSITKAQALMQQGELSSEALVNYYLQRIAAIDKAGPSLNAVVQLNTHAIADARRLDKERLATGSRGPLHGIPVLLKDNIDTADGMANTAGSLALKHNLPNSDADVVARLRKAGAVILGKTNLSEWANFRSLRSASGWSGLWGQSRNPYDITTSPCGSSAGSGVAVAADLTLVAVGTETDGSIVCPSSVNGIVGIKPSLGLVSQRGIIPIAHSQDTAGPMARNLSDAVLLLESMLEKKSALQTSELSAHLKQDGLKAKRIGVLRNFMGFHEEVDALFELAIAKMRQQGAILVDIELNIDMESLGDAEYTVLLYEFKQGLNSYLKQAGTDLSLEKIIAFNQRHSEIEMAYFQQEIFHLAQSKGELSDSEYQQALALSKTLAGEQGIDAVLKQHSLNLLIAPTDIAAWKIDWVNGDISLGAGTSTPAAVAGYPHITIPMGYVHHLPVGMSFFAGNFSEAVLIEAAYGYEQASKHRRSPKLSLP